MSYKVKEQFMLDCNFATQSLAELQVQIRCLQKMFDTLYNKPYAVKGHDKEGDNKKYDGNDKWENP